MESLIPIQDEEDFDTQIPTPPQTQEKTEDTKEEKIAQAQDTSDIDALSMLEAKIDEIVNKYHNSNNENSSLKEQIATLQSQNSMLAKQIVEFEEKLQAKDLKAQDLSSKLDKLL